jgi:hypothetical protein
MRSARRNNERTRVKNLPDADRELLRLAAKAAGYNVVFDGDGSWIESQYWNPLTSDGDALRLAVKLGYPHMIGTWMGCYLEKGEYEHDPYTATRRAIVRAAAEIGKDMK